MTMSATFPVIVTPEAATRVAELGFQDQVGCMLDYARDHLPDVVRVEVVLNERYDLGGEPGVAIEAYGRRPFDPAERISEDLGQWLVSAFRPEILEHLHISYRPGADYVG